MKRQAAPFGRREEANGHHGGFGEENPISWNLLARVGEGARRELAPKYESWGSAVKFT